MESEISLQKISRGVWFLIHSIPLFCNCDDDFFSYCKFIQILPYIFICINCSIHISFFLYDYPVQNYIESKKELFYWSWLLHEQAKNNSKNSNHKHDEKELIDISFKDAYNNFINLFNILKLQKELYYLEDKLFNSDLSLEEISFNEEKIKNIKNKIKNKMNSKFAEEFNATQIQRGVWFILHSQSLNSKSVDERIALAKIIRILERTYVCIACSIHLIEFNHNKRPEDFTETAENMFYYTWLLHNHATQNANKKRPLNEQKKEMTFENAKKFWLINESDRYLQIQKYKENQANGIPEEKCESCGIDEEKFKAIDVYYLTNIDDNNMKIISKPKIKPNIAGVKINNYRG